MEVALSLQQGQSQTLLITPYFQQSLKVLQCGVDELSALVERELAENPALERHEEHEELPSDSPLFEDKDTHTFELQFNTATSSNPSSFDEERSLAFRSCEGESLQGVLFAQVIDLRLTESQRRIVAFVIRNLDEDGYLRISINELLEESHGSVLELEDAIHCIQSCEPPGVGARDLRECLLIQLNKVGQQDSLMGRIVENHLTLVQNKELREIARLENTTIAEVHEALASLKSFNPFPTRGLVREASSYISPDVAVVKVLHDYVVTVNQESLPKLRISSYYQALASDKSMLDREGRVYLNSRVRGASWLLRCICQREQTLRKISEVIVRRQRSFFDEGPQGLKPLSLKEVAQEIAVHESTVSRAVANKFIDTPHGIFQLKYFFAAGMRAKDTEVTTNSIKNRIRSMISAEDRSNPLSDQVIVQLLQASKIEIARRTVTKYREAMGIASSMLRKRATLHTNSALD